MSGFIKAFAKRNLPPRLIAALRILSWRAPIVYTGSYTSWEAVKRDAIGYEDPSILEKTRSSAQAVKDGLAAFESDSIAHPKPGFRWPLLACLLTSALQKTMSVGAGLHILDFGGSLGSVYFQHRVFLERIPDLTWSVVEQPHFVRCGNAEFADERLRYFDTIAEARARGPIDVVIFSGSLAYVDRPYETLATAVALDIKYIIIDQQQLVDGSQDEIKLQHVSPFYYSARLAVHFLAKEKLQAYLNSAGYEMTAALPLGFFFEKRSTAQP